MQSRTTVKLLALAAATGLAWALVPSAEAKNSLNCTVVDENGKPVAKQEMILSSAQDKEWKKKTNDKGQVEFGGLEDGAYQLRGNVEGYVLSKSEPLEVSGNVEKACNHKLMSVNYANSLLVEVQELLQQKKFPEAQEKGVKAIDALPNESAAHYMLAVAYAYQGNGADATVAMKKAAELNPEKFEKMVPVVQLAALDAQVKEAEAKKDLDGMMKKYEEMLAVTDDKATVYFNMATAYGRFNKFEEAIETIDKAIELKPDDAEIQQVKLRLQDMYLKAMEQKLEK